MPPELVAYLVILCFKRRHPKQYCCSPKIKYFGPTNFFPPQKFWADYATDLHYPRSLVRAAKMSPILEMKNEYCHYLLNQFLLAQVCRNDSWD